MSTEVSLGNMLPQFKETPGTLKHNSSRGQGGWHQKQKNKHALTRNIKSQNSLVP